jgi:hypothetical protein
MWIPDSASLFNEFVDCNLTRFHALHAGGKKLETHLRGDKQVEESEQPTPSVPYSVAATPSRAQNVVDIRTPGADLTLGTGPDFGSAKNMTKRRKF